MFGLTEGDLLFYSGIAIMAISAVGATVAIILFSLSKKRLQAQLEQEYGKKRN